MTLSAFEPPRWSASVECSILLPSELRQIPLPSFCGGPVRLRTGALLQHRFRSSHAVDGPGGISRTGARQSFRQEAQSDAIGDAGIFGTHFHRRYAARGRNSEATRRDCSRRYLGSCDRLRDPLRNKLRARCRLATSNNLISVCRFLAYGGRDASAEQFDCVHQLRVR